MGLGGGAEKLPEPLGMTVSDSVTLADAKWRLARRRGALRGARATSNSQPGLHTSTAAVSAAAARPISQPEYSNSLSLTPR